MSSYDLVYQVELGVDLAERSGINSGRNSFVGYKTSLGQFAIGQHDTPLKNVRGNGAVIFGDKIADSRTLISVGALSGGAQLDERAKNAMWWISPNFYNVELFFMYATDNSSDNKPDDNENSLVGANITYKGEHLYLGLGIENNADPDATDIFATRLATRVKFGPVSVGGMLEISDRGAGDQMTRNAGIANVMIEFSDNHHAGVQFSMVGEYDDSVDTNANNVSFGYEFNYTSSTLLYFVGTFTLNGDQATFGMAQSGTGEAFRASAAGDNVYGISFGIEHKF